MEKVEIANTLQIEANWGCANLAKNNQERLARDVGQPQFAICNLLVVFGQICTAHKLLFSSFWPKFFHYHSIS